MRNPIPHHRMKSGVEKKHLCVASCCRISFPNRVDIITQSIKHNLTTFLISISKKPSPMQKHRRRRRKLLGSTSICHSSCPITAASRTKLLFHFALSAHGGTSRILLPKALSADGAFSLLRRIDPLLFPIFAFFKLLSLYAEFFVLSSHILQRES